MALFGGGGKDGLDAASQARLRAVHEMLREISDDGTVRRAILKDLRVPATAVAAKQRAAARALTGVPSEWKQHAAANVRVLASLGRTRPNVAVALRRSGSGPTARPGWNLNRGEWRHPVFGRRTQWVTQRTTAGWFDNTGKAARPVFLTTAAQALDRATEDLARRISELK